MSGLGFGSLLYVADGVPSLYGGGGTLAVQPLGQAAYRDYVEARRFMLSLGDRPNVLIDRSGQKAWLALPGWSPDAVQSDGPGMISDSVGLGHDGDTGSPAGLASESLIEVLSEAMTLPGWWSGPDAAGRFLDALRPDIAGASERGNPDYGSNPPGISHWGLCGREQDDAVRAMPEGSGSGDTSLSAALDDFAAKWSGADGIPEVKRVFETLSPEMKLQESMRDPVIFARFLSALRPPADMSDPAVLARCRSILRTPADLARAILGAGPADLDAAGDLADGFGAPDPEPPADADPRPHAKPLPARSLRAPQVMAVGVFTR